MLENFLLQIPIAQDPLLHVQVKVVKLTLDLESHAPHIIYYFFLLLFLCGLLSLVSSILSSLSFRKIRYFIIIWFYFPFYFSKRNNTHYLHLLQISLLPRRQLFLNRNIRKFKLRNVLTKAETATVTASSVTETATANIQEKSKIASDDASIVVQSTIEATSTVTNETITSTTADALVTSTATTTQSTITSNTSTTVSTSTPETIDITTSASKNATILHPPSRPLERAGSGCNDGYFIDDRSEININFQKYRMVFVVNKDAVFYKKNAFRQAKLVSHMNRLHPTIWPHVWNHFNFVSYFPFFFLPSDSSGRYKINVKEIP